MSYWYVASPYTHEDEGIMEQRYDAVIDFCAQMAREGQLIYSPIAHWHPIASFYDLPRDHVFWEELDSAMIKASRGIIILKIPGWYESRGVQREIEFARERALPVTYYGLLGDEWMEETE